MGDMGDVFRAMKETRKRDRAKYGVSCPICVAKRPKAHASILLPQQRCRVCRYVDPRHPDILEREI